MSTRPKTDNINLSTKDNAIPPVIVTDAEGNIVEYTDADGFHAIRYRDEYVGGDWVTPQGAASPDVVSVTIGGVGTQMLGFNGQNTEERKGNHYEIAHDLPIALINSGVLKLEQHWHARPSNNNAGVVKWFFDWSYSPPRDNGGTFAPIPMDSLVAYHNVLENTEHHHYIDGVELPVPLGGYQIGGIITFNIRRTPTDVEDTYNADILLIKTALHVPTDGDGSRTRYHK